MLPLLLPLALAWDVRGPDDRPTGATLVAAERFPARAPGWEGAAVVTDPAALAFVAEEALAWLRAARGVDPAADPGLFAELGVTDARAEATLQLVIDAARDTPARLTDPAWVAATFETRAWTPDPADPAAARLRLGPGEVRVTRYLTTQVAGSTAPDATHDQALWADPGEPWRTRYTRREVCEGAFRTGPDAGRSTPLVWVTEAAFHDALMQGSAEVATPDGRVVTYGVDVPNGRAYVPGRRGRDQDRFWFFRALPEGPRGWGPPGLPELNLRAGVAVAGDVFNLGVGRLVVVEHPDGRGGTTLRLAVLADSGGAFQPNLHQLDWYGGAFPSHDALYAAWRGLPDRARAWVLVAREETGP